MNNVVINHHTINEYIQFVNVFFSLINVRNLTNYYLIFYVILFKDLFCIKEVFIYLKNKDRNWMMETTNENMVWINDLRYVKVSKHRRY
jgi:hypothetical protein